MALPRTEITSKSRCVISLASSLKLLELVDWPCNLPPTILHLATPLWPYYNSLKGF